MDVYARIPPSAFGDKPKTVPIVIYETAGKRQVVGQVTITPKGNRLEITGHITDVEVAKQVGYATEWMEGFTVLTTPSPKPAPKIKKDGA